MNLRRHRRLTAVLLAFALAGAQWLLGRGSSAGAACAASGCPPVEAGAGSPSAHVASR